MADQGFESRGVSFEPVHHVTAERGSGCARIEGRIARRFGQLAEQAFDGIKIHYVHDKSLTDRMKSLAQSADIFVVNTWDAKHAATNGIKVNRPGSLLTIEPKGKSSTSLLRSLLDSVNANPA